MDTKVEVLRLRIDTDTKELFRKKAEENGVTMSQYMLYLIRKDLGLKTLTDEK